MDCPYGQCKCGIALPCCCLYETNNNVMGDDDRKKLDQKVQQNRKYLLEKMREPKWKRMVKQKNAESPPVTENRLKQQNLNDDPTPNNVFGPQCPCADFTSSNDQCPDECNDKERSAEKPDEPMYSIGPWATGRVDWRPDAGLTGIRPVVDRYSITKYSPMEWQQRNANLFAKDGQIFDTNLKIENDTKNRMSKTHALIDRTQADSTNRLKLRTSDINKWKTTLERAIAAQQDEISTLEEQRLRLKKSMAVLKLPESIATECLSIRCGRNDTELVRDKPEEEIINEISLISEIRKVLIQTLKDIEQQQIANRAARARLENDWSDKKDAFENDAINSGLNNKSTTILFKNGATRYMNEQSSEEYWEHFTKETLDECEKCRQRSIQLRSTLDAILMNAARDLRNQANKVEKALSDRIACMEDIQVKLEIDLKKCLNRLAETEKLIDRLMEGRENLDNCMKVAQTRLDNRNGRPNVENCRDRAQVGLVEEVKTVHNGMTDLSAAIQEAEDTKNQLIQSRGELEREIMLKLRSIMLDRDRCMVIRAQYPSATALSGF